MRFKLEYKNERSWFRNQLVWLSFVPIMGAGFLAMALSFAVNHGGIDYLLCGAGVCAGCVLSIPMVKRIRPLLVGSKLDAAALEARKKPVNSAGSRVASLVVAAAIYWMLTYAPQAIRLLGQSCLGVWLLFFGVGLIWHFLRNHEQLLVLEKKNNGQRFSSEKESVLDPVVREDERVMR
jgi:hypothetical protein